MTVTQSAKVAPVAAPPAVLVVSDAPRLHRQASRLLGDAGFFPLSAVWSGADLRGDHALADDELVLYLSTQEASARIYAIRAICEVNPDLRLIAAMPDDASGAQLRRVLQAGVAGLVLDEALDRSLVQTVTAVLAGQLSVPLSSRKHVAPKALSHREKQILGLVVMGFTNRQIADKLYLAESTVKTHLSSSFAKLDTRNRAEAAALILDPVEGCGLGILSITNGERSPA